MVEAGILDGDCVLIRKQETAEDGDIVVALFGSEATRQSCTESGMNGFPEAQTARGPSSAPSTGS